MALLTKAIKLPRSAALGIYRAVVPYRRRITLWSLRKRASQKIRERVESIDFHLVRQCRTELQEIRDRHPHVKGVIIFAPSADWDVPLFQRPHQMAMAFASLGYLVLYWVRSQPKGTESRFRSIQKGLYLCNVPAPTFSVIADPVIISYTNNYSWVRCLPDDPNIIYELIDHLDIFSDYSKRVLEANHRKLLRNAALVVGTADDLVAELSASRPDALLCPNGVDIDHFTMSPAGETAVPDDLQEIAAHGGPIIGYYGALAEWFDFELVKHAARTMPNCNFVLIGPDYDGRRIRESGISALSNIYWLGPKPYSELPAYLRAFDVATIPFAVSDALQAVSPIKLFEYMAGGKPIVTTDLVECRKYPVVLIAHDREEWVQRLQQALDLGNDPDYVARVRQTAEANTWVARARQLVEAMEATGTQKSNSAIVLDTIAATTVSSNGATQ